MNNRYLWTWLTTVGLCTATPLATAQAKNSASKKKDSTRDEYDDEEEEEEVHPFQEGILTGPFTRRGTYSSLLLGFSRCMATRTSRCKGADVAGSRGKTRSSLAFSKEMGYRFPWFSIGIAYAMGFMRPSWQDPKDPSRRFYRLAYQHSVTAVFRPTLPVWIFDLGITIAPGWSRQVFRRKISRDRDFTQGMTFVTGAVLNAYVSKRWQVGFRYDIFFNRHRVLCEIDKEHKACEPFDSTSIAGVNMGMSGLYLSHRW